MLLLTTVSPSNFIVVGTDRASGKVCDVEEHPQVEVAWFIPPYQFRIRGTAVVIGEAGEFARAAQHLGASVDTPEGTYHYWRTKKEEIFNSLPGAMTQRYDHAPPRGAHPPAGVDNKHYNFVLIALVPKRVEVLDLLDKGYTTYVLTDKGWVEEPAAPVIKERAHI